MSTIDRRGSLGGFLTRLKTLFHSNSNSSGSHALPRRGASSSRVPDGVGSLDPHLGRARARAGVHTGSSQVSSGADIVPCAGTSRNAGMLYRDSSDDSGDDSASTHTSHTSRTTRSKSTASRVSRGKLKKSRRFRSHSQTSQNASLRMIVSDSLRDRHSSVHSDANTTDDRHDDFLAPHQLAPLIHPQQMRVVSFTPDVLNTASPQGIPIPYHTNYPVSLSAASINSNISIPLHDHYLRSTNGTIISSGNRPPSIASTTNTSLRHYGGLSGGGVGVGGGEGGATGGGGGGGGTRSIQSLYNTSIYTSGTGAGVGGGSHLMFLPTGSNAGGVLNGNASTISGGGGDRDTFRELGSRGDRGGGGSTMSGVDRMGAHLDNASIRGIPPATIVERAERERERDRRIGDVFSAVSVKTALSFGEKSGVTGTLDSRSVWSVGSG
ncbi:hypothetical protein HDU98_010126 [Podochytrium sp. JEL0797]|nr:hypothetical protein HDU98_010126 [Podochytrium sp. JEL0797]